MDTMDNSAPAPASSYGNTAAKSAGAKRKWEKPSSGDKEGEKRFKKGPGDWKKKGAHASEKKQLALTRKDRDQQKKERKALKPNADIIAEANKVRNERRMRALAA